MSESMIVIGLTGGIGSGKTTVSQMLASLGAVLINADKVGHEAYRPHSPVWQEVVAAFGPEILGPDQEIDRPKLAKIVFSDPEALKRLNAIMHPRMKEMMRGKIAELSQRGARVAVLEAAILIEAGWTDLADQVWVTVAPEEAVVERLRKLGISEESTRARIRSQMPIQERAARADVVIDTNCDLATVRARVGDLWRSLPVSGPPDQSQGGLT